jgi:hypothetical protein
MACLLSGIECGLRYLDPEGLDCSDLIRDS